MTTRGEMIINLTDALNAEREKTKQLREALGKIERIAKDPDNRGEHTQYQMAYFLDDVILPIIAAFEIGGKHEF